MAIAIFGGSFDPPHAGHAAVVSRVLDTLPIETLYIVPAYVNPFKRGTHAPPELRLQWLERIFASRERVRVSAFEIDQGRPVPSIETVRHFREIDTDIYLIIGADNLDALTKWHAFDELDRMVTWVVASRKGSEVPEHYLRLDVDVDISSTELRSLEKTHLIPDSVREEIENYYKEIQCKND
ncbi:nicotinate (nicotinamide) nucleotide adenylyltransferase [Sulfurimonas sp. HSL1-2]|uniref:nicotinate (nicotinamide) nucleotide adenylyltransferase n=1 Tax=Thiomicrolovo zhangzhouensis TaxID=3131933 RepID=UPI0031F760F3